MAERLDAYSFTRGTRSLYPWHEWLDGSVWKLTKDSDFGLSRESFRATAIGAASRRGMKLRTSLGQDDESIVIQAYDPEA